MPMWTGSNMENGNTGTAAGVVRVAVMMVASFRAGQVPGVGCSGDAAVQGYAACSGELGSLVSVGCGHGAGPLSGTMTPWRMGSPSR